MCSKCAYGCLIHYIQTELYEQPAVDSEADADDDEDVEPTVTK